MCDDDQHDYGEIDTSDCTIDADFSDMLGMGVVRRKGKLYQSLGQGSYRLLSVD